jgi:hypothetical protein
VRTVLQQRWWTESSGATLFAGCDYEAGTVLTEDHYPIPESPVAQTPVIDLRVTELSEGELTTLDFAELWIIDHPAADSVWASTGGTIWSGERVRKPDAVLLKGGPDVTFKMRSEDGDALGVSDRDTCIVVFGDTVSAPAQATPIIVAREKIPLFSVAPPGRRGLHFVEGAGVGGGDNIYPRKQWSRAVVDSPRVSRGDGIPDTLVIATGEYHQIDQIALIEEATEWTSKVVKPLFSATHSVHGSVTSSVAAMDTLSAEIREGEYVTLRFSYPTLQSGYRRLVVLRARGGYQLEESAKVLPAPEAPVVARWGVHKLVPNPTRGEVMIEFRTAGVGTPRILVFDVAGRQVADVPVSEGAGSHLLQWRATDAFGRPVPRGIYFVRLQEGGRNDVRKLVVVR